MVKQKVQNQLLLIQNGIYVLVVLANRGLLLCASKIVREGPMEVIMEDAKGDGLNHYRLPGLVVVEQHILHRLLNVVS